MTKRASAIAKGIAIFMMMFHHMFFSAEVIANQSRGVSFSSFPFTQDQLIAISYNFKICVAIFVFVTGYGTFRQLSSRASLQNNTAAQAANYSIQHIVKLCLNFLCVFIFVHVVCAFLGQPNNWFVPFYGGRGALVGAAYFVIDALGLSSLFGTPMFSYVWWYMGMAYFLLCLMPIVALVSKKVDCFILYLLMVCGYYLSGLEMNLLAWFPPIAVFGAFCAQHDIFERLFRIGATKSHPTRSALVSFALLVVALALFKLRIAMGLQPVIDALLAFCICGLSIGLEGWLSKLGLAFVGKHSLNIFLIHAFFLSSRVGVLLYGIGWFGASALGLLLITLLVSVVVEKGKALLGIPQLINRAASTVANSCWGC